MSWLYSPLPHAPGAGGAVNMTASITAGASVTAALNAYAAISATISAGASVSANLDTGAALTATISAGATLTGAATAYSALTTTISAAATLAGTLTTITITRPADRGRVDLTASGPVTEGANTVIEIAAQPSTDYDGGLGTATTRVQVVYARVQGVAGIANLRFRIKTHATAEHTGWRTNTKPQWRVHGGAWNTWANFANNSGGTDADKDAWDSSAFTDNDIDVAFNLPFPIGEVEDLVDDWAASGFAVEPASSVGGGAYRYGTIGGSNFADDRDASDLTGVTLNQKCIELTDPASPAPAGRGKALLALGTCVHSSEDAFSHGLAYMVDEWIADADLRSRFDLAVYPLIQPSGRYVGRRRGTSQIAARPGSVGAPTAIEGQDCNNEWNEATATHWSEEVFNTKTAFAADNLTARIIASKGGWFDMHTDGVGSDPNLFAYVGYPPDGARAKFVLPYADPFITGANYSLIESGSPAGGGSTGSWFETQGVMVSTTIETGHNVSDMRAFAEDVGRGTMQGLAAAFDAGELGAVTATAAITAGASVSGAATVYAAMTAAISAGATVACDADVYAALTATISTGAGVSGVASVVDNMTATVVAGAAVAGEATAFAAMSAMISAAGGVSGSASAVVVMAATISAGAAISGLLDSAEADLTASIAAGATVAASAMAIANITAGINAGASASGALTGYEGLTASVSAIAIIAATATSYAALTATIAATASVAAALSATGPGQPPARRRFDAAPAHRRFDAAPAIRSFAA